MSDGEKRNCSFITTATFYPFSNGISYFCEIMKHSQSYITAVIYQVAGRSVILGLYTPNGWYYQNIRIDNNTKDIGSASNSSALATLLNSELSGIMDGQTRNIRFNATASFAPFVSAHVYCGTLYKALGDTYAHCMFYSNANIHPITAVRGTSGWSFKEVVVSDDIGNKEDKWVRLDMSSTVSSVSFSMGTSPSPYAIVFIITSGYSINDHGVYILVRVSESLLKTAVKEASNMTISMDSNGVVTVTRSSAAAAYVLVKPITAGVYFN